MDRSQSVADAFAAQSGEFEWGVRDCVALAAEVVQRVTGKRVVLPTWDTEEEAQEEIARRGGLLAAVSEVLGAPMPAGQQCGDGDVVLLRAVVPGGAPFEMLGVWFGRAPVVHARHALMRANARNVVAAWSI